MKKQFLFIMLLSILANPGFAQVEANRQKKKGYIKYVNNVVDDSFAFLGQTELGKRDYALIKQVKAVVQPIQEGVSELITQEKAKQAELAKALDVATSLSDSYPEEDRRRITKEVIANAVDYGADLNKPVPCANSFRCKNANKLYATALHYVLAEKPAYNADVLVDELVKHGAEIDAVDDEGYTPLHYDAFGNGNWSRSLIDHGANPNAQDKDGNTPLNLALQAGEGRNAMLLMHSGANPKIKNNEGSTPLHLVRFNRANVIQNLIDIGAEVNAQDNNGKTPLDVAFFSVAQEVLIKNGAKKSEELK